MAEKIVKKVIIEVDDKGALKKTSKDSQTLNRNMKGLSKQSSNASKNFSKTAQGMQGVLVPAYAEVAARVFALTAVYQALTKASDFRILMQGQAEYAKRTGKNMAEISRSVQKASKGMLDFASASSSVALATTSGISSSQIVEMTKRAVDSSTALGRSVQDTMDRLTRGIVKAEPEILDEIGVIIRLDKVYKDYAESVKKSTTELTEGEKATARYNAIMAQLESKFGGIADAVDPNYIRASAAATLDILAQAGAKLIGVVNPIFKFLSETRAAIVVILLVIVKVLAGKIFPVFESFGARIIAFGEKGAASTQKYANKIKVLNEQMLRSKLIAKDLSTSIAKNIDPKYHTMGSGQKGKDKWAGATEAQKIKSLKAKTNFALRHIEGGVVTMGSMKGQTLAEVTAIDNAVNKLGQDLGNTHNKMQVLWNKGTISANIFRRTLAQVRMGFAETVANAGIYFGITKQLIADNGFLTGTWLGLKQVGNEWLAAAAKAGVYNQIVRQTKAVTGALGVVAAATAVAVNKIFAIVMIITMVISFGKMLLDMFIDFDTPFKRAADAVKELNSKLKEQSTLLSQKDKLINFEGAAENFDQAMANATFAENFSTSLYDATSDAMKALAAEMGEAGWWESSFDWVKGWIGMSSFDNMKGALGTQFDMLSETYPDILKKMRGSVDSEGNSIYGVLGRMPKGDLEKNLLSGGQMEYVNGYMRERFDQWKEGREFGQAQNYAAWSGQAHWLEPTTDYKDALATEPRLWTMEDWLEGLTGSLEGLSEELQRPILLSAWEDLKKRIKEQTKLDRARTADIKAMNDAFETLSKAEKKYTETLLIKTAVHDMAVQQRNVQKIMADDNILDSTKIFALQARGMVPDEKKSQAYRDMEDMMKRNKADRKKGLEGTWSQEEIAAKAVQAYADIEKLIPKIVGGIADWAEIERELTKNITDRLVNQHMLMVGDLYGGESTKSAQAHYQKLIDLTEIKQDKQIYNIALGEANLALEIDQLKMEQQRWVIWNKMSKLYLGQTYYQDEYQLGLKQSGRKETIAGKYAAQLKDAEANYKELLANAYLKGTEEEDAAKYLSSYIIAESRILSEMALAYTMDANKLMDGIAISAANVKEHLNSVITTLSKDHNMSDYLDRLEETGADKYMNLKGPMIPIIEMFSGQDKEMRALPAKIKATKLALDNLKIEQDNIGEHKILIGLRKTIAKIELNVQNEEAALIEKRLETAKAIATLQLEVNKLQLEQDLKLIKDTMKAVADGFGKAVGDAFKDIVSGVKEGKWDKFRNTMSDSLMNQAASSVGGMAQNAVFGNKGLVASGARSLLKGTKYAGIIDDIFPKTQLEVAQDSLAVLKEIRDKNGMSTLLAGKGSNTIANTGSMGDPAIDGIIWFAKLLWGNPHSAANGGIFPGGFRAFANGGIANKSTLGLIGEGKYNEAVVPLPDGKSIPVKGVGSNNVTVNVAIDSNGQAKATESTGGGAKELGYQISQAIQQELVTQQRPGGLLSSY